jgi:uncharacterized protein (UPF0212 family)
MHGRVAPAAEIEIGRFMCPNAKVGVPVKTSQPLAFVHWPVTIKKCPACGRKHEVRLSDVEHPPVYGYE